MNKQDVRALRLQADIIRGQIECLTSAAKHSPNEMGRIMSSIRVLESVARVIDAFVPKVEDLEDIAQRHIAIGEAKF